MKNLFKKLGWKINLAVYGVLIFFIFSPLISVAIATGVAAACGCELSEGNPVPCYVMGMDIGGLLPGMFVAGWFIFFTIFYGLIAVVLYSIYIAIGYLLNRSGKSNTA